MTCRCAYGLTLLLVGMILGAVGCGAKPVTIKGQVTLDDQPVGPGSIVFLPQGGTDTRRAAAAIEDGKYEIPADRAPGPGMFRVEIVWDKKTGRKVPSADPGMMSDETRQVMPAKFNKDSQLTAEIAPGENVKDFHLQSR